VETKPAKWWFWGGAFAFLALSVALRLYNLTLKPLWIAEIQEFVYAYRGGVTDNLLFSAGDFVGFFYHRMCHLLGLSPAPGVVRGLAVLAGSLLAPVIYLAAARRGRWLEGAIAALLTALSMPLIAASQEARLYAGLQLFLTAGLVVDLYWDAGRRKVAALAVADALALLCHPYAVVWIGTRWLSQLRPDILQRLPTRRAFMAYVPAVAVPLAIQVIEILSAHQRYRVLHDYFSLQPYAPAPGFFLELFGHLGTGEGWPAHLFVALTAAGLLLMLEHDTRRMVTLGLWALLAPFALLVAMWLGKGRFSYVHMLPAAPALYLLAAHGLTGVLRAPVNRWATRGALAIAIGAIATQMTLLDVRYLQRPTRLEMGSDVGAVCAHLGEQLKPGDLVVTRYDKYFTALSFYCGRELPPATPFLVPSVPDSDFASYFLHLGAEPGEPLLQQAQVTEMNSFEWPAGGAAKVFLVLPLFEEIEGNFSESVGWYRLDSAYGPTAASEPSLPLAWETFRFPVMNVYVRQVQNAADFSSAKTEVKEIVRSLPIPWI